MKKYCLILLILIYPQVKLPAQEIQADTVTFIAAGDVLLARQGIVELIKTYDEKYPFAKVAGYIKSADIAACNLECCISTRGVEFKKQWTFKADPERIESLIYSGFHVMNLANNHSVDFGKEALIDTFEILASSGFLKVGAGYNIEDANSGALVERNNLRIVFLGYSCVLHESYFAKKNSPGVVPGYSEHYIKKAIENWRSKTDLIIVFFHWGKEYIYQPTQAQIDMAHSTINLGADLVIGHHPHVFQGIEIYKSKPIVYSLGNFVFMPNREEAKETILPKFVLGKKGVEKIIINPVKINYGQPYIPKSQLGKDILNKYVLLCSNLGTGVSLSEDGLTGTVDLTTTTYQIQRTTYTIFVSTAVKQVRIKKEPKSRYEIVVDKFNHKLMLIGESTGTIKEYLISAGKNTGDKQAEGDMRTPEGDFRIISIEDSSSWRFDFGDGKGPIKRAYGTYFIRLNGKWKGIGIHGTHDETLIGFDNSHGCIRMRNSDLFELKKLVSIGTPVKILGETQK